MVKAIQKTIDGGEAWEGVCCEACWYARKKKCTCKCGGGNHGKGLLKTSNKIDLEVKE